MLPNWSLVLVMDALAFELVPLVGTSQVVHLRLVRPRSGFLFVEGVGDTQTVAASDGLVLHAHR